eukprot:1066889_1
MTEMFTVIMCPSLHNLRFAISFFVLSQMILSTEGQNSYALVGGATSISATSILDGDDACQPADAKYNLGNECWCSNTQDCSDNPILTIDLGSIHQITSVAVMSCSWEEYITSYKIEYYYDDSWAWYKNGESLTGNNGCCTERQASLSPAVIATKIRLYPLTAHSWCSTNFEAYGYPMLSPKTISGFIIIALSWLFGIISVYCLYQFYQLQSSRRQSVQEMTFIKRRANLVVAFSLCSIYVLLIGYPSGMLVHWGF